MNEKASQHMNVRMAILYTMLKDSKVVLFGAGQNGRAILKKLLDNGILPAYFVDNNPKIKFVGYDDGAREAGALTVNMPNVLLSEDRSFLKIIITPDAPLDEEIKTQIRQMQLSECIFSENIICCDYIARPNLGFFNEYIGFCCNANSDFNMGRPEFYYMDTAEETILNFLHKRKKLISELNNIFPVDEAKPCVNCTRLKKHNLLTLDSKIKHISISCLPSICQAKCIYCSVHTDPQNTYEISRHSHYPKMIAEMILYLRKNNLISNNCTFYFAPAEISIMPHKELLLDAAADYHAGFSTNGFVFEQRIADSLKKNRSRVVVSLDSGTRETFKLVKGLDLFDKTIENLKMYREYGNVLVKYNILSGINDSEGDLNGIINVLEILQLNTLLLSFEYNMPLRTAFYSIAKFVTKLKENGFSFTFYTYYTPYQIDRFIELYFTAEHQAMYKKQNDHLREVFQKEFINDYEAYKKYVYLFEIKELIKQFREGTRFALLGHVSHDQYIISAFNQLAIPLQTPDVHYEESYDAVKYSADIFIMRNKWKVNDVKTFIDKKGGDSRRLLDVETYYYSFEPTKLFLEQNTAREYLKD